MSWAGPKVNKRLQGCDMCLRELSVAAPCWSATGCNHVKSCSCGMVYCGHKYCMDCIAAIFELGYKSEAYFPPRCCGSPLHDCIQDGFKNVWVKLAEHGGGKQTAEALRDLFYSKTREYGYRTRVYCAGCDNTVHVQNILGLGTCACEGTKKTCITCAKGVNVTDTQCRGCLEERSELKNEADLYKELPRFRDPKKYTHSLVQQGFLECFKCGLEIPATKIRPKQSPNHDHTKCAVDVDRKKILKDAKAIGLDVRMCNSCGRILERVGTCRELPCPCGSIFCHNCSHKMASCVCTDELLNKQKQANPNPERGHFCAHINFVRLEPKEEEEEEGGPQACAFCFRKFTGGVGEGGPSAGPRRREPVFKCIGNNCGLKACGSCARNLGGKMKALVHARHAAGGVVDMFKDLTRVDDLLFD